MFESIKEFTDSQRKKTNNKNFREVAHRMKPMLFRDEDLQLVYAGNIISFSESNPPSMCYLALTNKRVFFITYLSFLRFERADVLSFRLSDLKKAFVEDINSFPLHQEYLVLEIGYNVYYLSTQSVSLDALVIQIEQIAQQYSATQQAPPAQSSHLPDNVPTNKGRANAPEQTPTTPPKDSESAVPESIAGKSAVDWIKNL